MKNESEPLKMESHAKNDVSRILLRNMNIGERFLYKGIEFIILEKYASAFLCMLAYNWCVDKFDEEGHNNWKTSTLRSKLNTEFLSLIGTEDLVDYVSDLTDDDGNVEYGSSRDMIGLLSMELYRECRDVIPTYIHGTYMCSPWKCVPVKHDIEDYPFIRSISPDDNTGSFVVPFSKYGVVPVCMFKKSTLVNRKEFEQ